jgi:hypothetical protein
MRKWNIAYAIKFHNSSYRTYLLKELEQWDKWEENPVVVIPDKPVNTVQAKIEQYRQQVVKSPETLTEEQLNFFEVIVNRIIVLNNSLKLNFLCRTWPQKLLDKPSF